MAIITIAPGPTRGFAATHSMLVYKFLIAEFIVSTRQAGAK